MAPPGRERKRGERERKREREREIEREREMDSATERSRKIERGIETEREREREDYACFERETLSDPLPRNNCLMPERCSRCHLLTQQTKNAEAE
jgi:hypothetical protein